MKNDVKSGARLEKLTFFSSSTFIISFKFLKEKGLPKIIGMQGC